MNRKLVMVAAAVIRKKDLILIAQRKKTSFLEPNKWEFPGGKVESFETNEECLRREVQEELGIEVAVKELFMVHTHIYRKGEKVYPIQLYVYLADWISGQARNIDCQDSKWVSLDELERFDFVEGDTPILHELLMKFKLL